MNRRSVISGLLATAALPACAEAPATSARPTVRGTIPDLTQSRAEALIAQSGLSGKVAFVLSSATTGEVLAANLPQLPLPPASVAKVPTALYALNTLGPTFRFITQVIATGPITNGRLQGDLVLIGSGDPTFDTDALANLARQIKSAGIKKVDGRLLVWAGALNEIDQIDPSQPVHVGYNPSISGLNLNFNRVHFEWRRQNGSYSTSMDARSDDLRPAVQGVRASIANRDLPVFQYRKRSGREEWSVARTALGNGGSRWLPVRRPALYSGEVFGVLLRGQGVQVPESSEVRAKPQGTVVAQVESAPLADQVRGMLKFSTNLTAEVLGLRATLARSESNTRSLSASAAEMNRWIEAATGIKAPGFDDHSGLSGGSRISAADMAAMLASPVARAGLPDVLKTIRPTKTALEQGFNTETTILAKTGTLNFVSTLSGYLIGPSGEQRCFAIFCSDLRTRNGLSKSQREAPPGGKRWLRKAKRLQMSLLTQWSQNLV